MQTKGAWSAYLHGTLYVDSTDSTMFFSIPDCKGLARTTKAGRGVITGLAGNFDLEQLSVCIMHWHNLNLSSGYYVSLCVVTC